MATVEARKKLSFPFQHFSTIERQGLAILHLVKISFRNEGDLKTSSDERKERIC